MQALENLVDGFSDQCSDPHDDVQCHKMKHSEPVDNSVTVDIEARVKEYQHSLED